MVQCTLYCDMYAIVGYKSKISANVGYPAKKRETLGYLINIGYLINSRGYKSKNRQTLGYLINFLLLGREPRNETDLSPYVCTYTF